VGDLAQDGWVLALGAGYKVGQLPLALVSISLADGAIKRGGLTLRVEAAGSLVAISTPPDDPATALSMHTQLWYSFRYGNMKGTRIADCSQLVPTHRLTP
jgi:hypothetical protein